jgi:hypothetical protein
VSLVPATRECSSNLLKTKRKFETPTPATGTIKRPKLETPAKSCEIETAGDQTNGDQDVLEVSYNDTENEAPIRPGRRKPTRESTVGFHQEDVSLLSHY